MSLKIITLFLVIGFLMQRRVLFLYSTIDIYSMYVYTKCKPLMHYTPTLMYDHSTMST